MSRIRGGAKGRKAKNKNEREWYPTPAWVVWRLLERISLPERALSILEPCSGDGALVDAVDMMRAKRDIWTTCDIRPEARVSSSATHYTGDMFEIVPRLASCIQGTPNGARWDLAPTNPPFTKAERIVEMLVPRCDRVALLLGSDWYNGPRVPTLARFPVSRVIVVPDRISFDGEGQDQRVYAWFVWERSDIGRTDIMTTLEMAAQTPASVIKQYKLAAKERIQQHRLELAGQTRLYA